MEKAKANIKLDDAKDGTAGRCATTIETAPKNKHTPAAAAETKKVTPLAEFLTAPVATPSAAVPTNEARDAAHRERRYNPEGRRGRFAEKTPPGTRTKMLKIIYERRAEMAEKRRLQWAIKLIVAFVLIITIGYGCQQFYLSATESVKSAVTSLPIQKWWDNVSTHPKPVPQRTLPSVPQTQVRKPVYKTTTTTYTARPRTLARKPLARPALKPIHTTNRNSKLPRGRNR